MVVFDDIVFSIQRGGGISVVWQQLLDYVAKRGMQHVAFDYPGCESNIFRKLLSPEVNVKSVKPVLPFKIARYADFSFPSKEPFLFHSSYYRLCSNKRAQNITTVHDFTYELGRDSLARKVHSWQKNRAIRGSRYVVCISENTKRDLMRFVPGVPEERIKVIYNGVDEGYRPVDNPLPEYSDHLLFVGSRLGYKNFGLVLDAISDTHKKLLICGAPLSENEKAKLAATLRPEQWELKVRPSNEELNLLYNSVFALAYPSSYEGFGIPVVEAQKAGCPVIAADRSSIPEVIGSKDFLMKDPTATEFKTRMNDLENDKVRTQLIEAGFDKAAQFSWKRMADEYMALYDSLLINI